MQSLHRFIQAACDLSLPARVLQLDSLQDVRSLQLTLSAEDANKNLHKFRGKAQLVDERLRDLPLSPGTVQENGNLGAVRAALVIFAGCPF